MTDTFDCGDCPLADPADCMKVGYCEHRDMPRAAMLYELADRVGVLTTADRDLDGEIAEKAYGWLPVKLGPDAAGENACEVLTQNGKLAGGGFAYPPKGMVHRAYHCPEYTRDCRDGALARDSIRRQTVAGLRALAVREQRAKQP